MKTKYQNSFLLLLVSAIGACSPTPNQVANSRELSAPSSNQISILVQRLVSPVGPPGPEITEYPAKGKDDPTKLDQYLKALGNGVMHPQVQEARQALIAMGPSVFPDLVKHLSDTRYSYSFCYSTWVNHSVADMIVRIMEDVAGFTGAGYKSRDNPHGSNVQPSFSQMIRELGPEKYAERVRGFTSSQAKIYYLKWYIQKERAYGFVTHEQEEECLGEYLNILSNLQSAQNSLKTQK